MNRIKNIALFVGFLMAVGLASCTKDLDDFGPQNSDNDNPVPFNQRIIVLNEGNFNWGNGSVSIIDESGETVAKEVFKQANGVPVGDVPQSMIVHDSLGYIVVNNSGKIEVVNMDDFSSVKTITGFTSPRYMQIVSTQPLIAWVTDLYADKIWKVDLDQGTIIGSITAQGWSESIYVNEGNCFVLNLTDSVINVFDIATETKFHTYTTGSPITDFKLWSNNELVALSQMGIYKLDMNSVGSEEVMHVFSTLRSPSRLATDTINETIYFIEYGDVHRFKPNQSSNIPVIIPSREGSNWYGLAVHPLTGDILVTDAKDYVQPGEVRSYSFDMSDSVIYEMGINPQFLLF